jgi:hypothetical protein
MAGGSMEQLWHSTRNEILLSFASAVSIDLRLRCLRALQVTGHPVEFSGIPGESRFESLRSASPG